jgi:hypothetical protein
LAGRLAATLNKLLKGRGELPKLSEAVGNGKAAGVFVEAVKIRGDRKVGTNANQDTRYASSL